MNQQTNNGMSLSEVLKLAIENPDKWFRPVTWDGLGMAYTIKDGNTEMVPTSRGGMIDMTFHVNELIGEWGLISPDDVLKERE